jgi:hypothetical protein
MVVPLDCVQQKWQSVVVIVTDFVSHHPDQTLLLLSQLTVSTLVVIHHLLKLNNVSFTGVPVLQEKNTEELFLTLLNQLLPTFGKETDTHKCKEIP